MTFREIDTVMTGYGFDHMSTANPSTAPVYNYAKMINGISVHCSVDELGYFSFMTTAGLVRLEVGKCSPVTSELHFNKILKQLIEASTFGVTRGIGLDEMTKATMISVVGQGGPF